MAVTEMISNIIPMRLDEKNTFKHMGKIHATVYEDIDEILQNAFDSTNSPKIDSNIININVPRKTKYNNDNLVIEVSDHGHSLLIDENGNRRSILDFCTEKKAVSKKMDDNRFSGNNGIGIISFLSIGRRFEIVSMDSELIVATWGERVNDMPSWVGHDITPASSKNKNKYRINHTGTIVRIYDGIKPVELYKLKNHIQETWSFKFWENPNIKLYINNNRMELPDKLKGRKPKELFKLSNGSSVTGYIEYDENGKGVIDHHKNAQFIESYAPKPKMCSGVTNNDTLGLNIERGGLDSNPLKEEYDEKICEFVKDFPDCVSDTPCISKLSSNDNEWVWHQIEDLPLEMMKQSNGMPLIPVQGKNITDIDPSPTKNNDTKPIEGPHKPRAKRPFRIDYAEKVPSGLLVSIGKSDKGNIVVIYMKHDSYKSKFIPKPKRDALLGNFALARALFLNPQMEAEIKTIDNELSLVDRKQ